MNPSPFLTDTTEKRDVSDEGDQKTEVTAGPEFVESHMADEAQARIEEGMRLLLECGQHEDALREFLWCWDHSLEVNPYFCGVRTSFLLHFLKKLADEYPRCREEMAARKAALQQHLATEDDDCLRRDVAKLEEYGF